MTPPLLLEMDMKLWKEDSVSPVISIPVLKHKVLGLSSSIILCVSATVPEVP